MKKYRDSEKEQIAMMISIVIMVAVFAFDWILYCGVIKLITMCFGWTFKWSVATGIWLVTLLAKHIFRRDE